MFPFLSGMTVYKLAYKYSAYKYTYINRLESTLEKVMYNICNKSYDSDIKMKETRFD